MTETGGDETGDETGGPGGPGDETGDKTAATAGDERDGEIGGVMCTDEGELEFESTSAICVWRALRNLRWRTLRKTLKRWWGRLDKRPVATESGGDETGDKSGGTRRSRGRDRRQDGGDGW